MSYKKMKLRALMLGLMAILFAGFVSCSNSDDEEDNPQPTEVAGIAFTLDVESSEDELAIGNVVIEYLDANGKNLTESITEKKWNKTIYFYKLPANVAYTIKHSMKEGVELNKDKYTLSMSVTPSCNVIFSDNSSKPSAEAYFIGKTFSETTPKDYVSEVFKKKNGIITSYEYTIKKSASGEDVVAE